MSMYELGSGRLLWQAQQETYLDASKLQGVAFSPDGRTMLADSAMGLWVWDAASGELLRRLDDPPSEVSSLAFSGDSRLIRSAGVNPPGLLERGRQPAAVWPSRRRAGHRGGGAGSFSGS